MCSSAALIVISWKLVKLELERARKFKTQTIVRGMMLFNIVSRRLTVGELTLAVDISLERSYNRQEDGRGTGYLGRRKQQRSLHTNDARSMSAP